MTDENAQLEVILRRAEPGDAIALIRLAQLDTRTLPPGPHLIAVRGGAIEAAISLSNGEVVANPFSRTAELCDLLLLHAAAAPRPVGRRRRGDLRPIPLTAPA